MKTKQESREANINLRDLLSWKFVRRGQNSILPPPHLNSFKSWFVLPIEDCQIDIHPTWIDLFLFFPPLWFSNNFFFFLIKSKLGSRPRGFGLETKDWIIQRREEEDGWKEVTRMNKFTYDNLYNGELCCPFNSSHFLLWDNLKLKFFPSKTRRRTCISGRDDRTLRTIKTLKRE